MAPRSRPDRPDWPVGPVPIATGVAELRRDPDRSTAATLLVNGAESSYVDLADPTRLVFEYLDQMAAVVERHATARPAGAGPLRVVHLGAAGCTLARWVAARWPARQLAVDVDARLAELVRAWFDLPRAPLLRLRVGDAREVLAALPPGGADVVVRDVFADAATPRHLTTAEFTGLVRRALAPGGIYLANCADRPPLDLARAEAATIAATFAHPALVAEPGVLRGRRYGNVVLIGSDDPGLADPTLARALRSLPVPARLVVGDDLDELLAGHAVRHD